MTANLTIPSYVLRESALHKSYSGSPRRAGQPVHPRSWTEGLATPYRHSSSLALWSVTLLGMFWTCRLPSIRFPMNLSASKVNTAWDKYKPLRNPPQLSAVNPFQHWKASTEAFMYAWLCSQLLSCHVSRSLSSTPCTHRTSVLVFIHHGRSYQQARDKAAPSAVLLYKTHYYFTDWKTDVLSLCLSRSQTESVSEMQKYCKFFCRQFTFCWEKHGLR